MGWEKERKWLMPFLNVERWAKGVTIKQFPLPSSLSMNRLPNCRAGAFKGKLSLIVKSEQGSDSATCAATVFIGEFHSWARWVPWAPGEPLGSWLVPDLAHLWCQPTIVMIDWLIPGCNWSLLFLHAALPGLFSNEGIALATLSENYTREESPFLKACHYYCNKPGKDAYLHFCATFLRNPSKAFARINELLFTAQFVAGSAFVLFSVERLTQAQMCYLWTDGYYLVETVFSLLQRGTFLMSNWLFLKV